MIRRIDFSEAVRLADFLRACFVDSYGASAPAGDVDAFLAAHYHRDAQAAELGDPGRLSMLITDAQGHWAGVAQLQLARAGTPAAGDGTAWLDRFYVDRAHHGTGLAQRLLAATLASARASGAQAIELSVWQQAPRAIRFYEGAGFKRVEAVRFFIGNTPMDDWRMRLAPLTGTQA